MVCPVCPLFQPLIPRHANPCAHPADTLQHKLRFGDLRERHNRLSLLHQAPCSCQPCSDRPGSVHWACARCVLSDLLLHMARSHLGSPAGSCICTANGKLQPMSPQGAQSPPTESLEVPCPTPTASCCVVKLSASAATMGLVIHCSNNGPGNPLPPSVHTPHASVCKCWQACLHHLCWMGGGLIRQGYCLLVRMALCCSHSCMHVRVGFVQLVHAHALLVIV